MLAPTQGQATLLKIQVYWGLDVDKVEVSHTADVFDLRDAIKIQFAPKSDPHAASKLILRTKDAAGIFRVLKADVRTTVGEELRDGAKVFVEVRSSASSAGVQIAPVPPLEALSNYLLVSSEIQNSAEWQAVQSKIEECAMDPSCPFILLDGPSGVGKTQLALSQAKKSIYLLLTAPSSSSSQLVYKPFLRQTLSLLAEIRKDIPRLQAQNVQEFDMNEIFPDQTYFTLGYLARLWNELDLQNTEEEKEKWPLRQAQLRFCFESVAISIDEFRERCPDFLLLLDETPFIGNDPQKKIFVKFIRNLARKAGVVILLGTNSTLTNVDCCGIVDCGSRGDRPQTWCHVFTSYPRPTLASLKIRLPEIEEWVKGERCSKPLANFLNYVIESHRPWLTILFLKFLLSSKAKTDLDILQDVCNQVGRAITDSKRKENGLMWLVGQKRLPLCAYRAVKRQIVNHMTHGHMAYLGLPGRVKSVTLEISNNNILCDGAAFEPYAHFPRAAEEALLYLGLLQSSSTNAFTDSSGQRMATCQAYEAAPRASSEVCLVNSQAVKRDGDKCEVILAVGMIIASHEAWLGGQTVYSFLPRLFYEVCGVKAELSKKGIAYVKKRFRGRKIGYLSPLGSAWPKPVVQFPGALVATPCRLPDKRKFDVDCMPGGEEVEFESENEEEEKEEEKKEEEEEQDEGDEEEDEEEEDEEEEDVEEEDVEEEDDASTEAMVRLTGEAKNRKDKFSLLEMAARISEESELHLVLGYSIAKSTRDLEAVQNSGALLVRLVLGVGGKWSLEQIGDYEAKHLVILIDRTAIKEQLEKKEKKTPSRKETTKAQKRKASNAETKAPKSAKPGTAAKGTKGEKKPINPRLRETSSFRSF